MASAESVRGAEPRRSLARHRSGRTVAVALPGPAGQLQGAAEEADRGVHQEEAQVRGDLQGA